MQPKNKSILVIDREAELNELVCTVLEGEGYRAAGASNLDTAVGLLSSLRFDLVISNYMSSSARRGSRWPILEMLKALAEPGTPIIVLTASAVALRQGAQQLGVYDMIEKPFDLSDLLQRVEAAMAGRSGKASER